MKRARRILLLVHPYFRPDRRGPARSLSERHVWLALKRLGYKCHVSAVQDRMEVLADDIYTFKPDIAFNLLEEFHDEAIMDFYPVSFLAHRGILCTGCSPEGLIVSRHKAWVTETARAIGINVPATFFARAVLRGRRLPFPMILKFNTEHASFGINSNNLVRTTVAFQRRWREMARCHSDEILAQEFVAGREFSVGVWGGGLKAEALPPQELYLGSDMAFATERIKFSRGFQRKKWILARSFRGDCELARRMQADALHIYRELRLNGYARVDFRIRSNGEAFLLDVNANPNLARAEDFARSAAQAGYSYEDMIREIVRQAQ